MAQDESRFRLTDDDVEPLLDGLTIMGTGGGGSPAFGREILLNDLRRGRMIELIDPDRIDDEAMVVSGGYMGSTKVLDRLGFAKLVAGWEDRFELLEVTRVMEGLLRRPITHLVPFEIGALNTPVILSAAARLGLTTIDGDGLGRSAPETQMSSFIGHGISLTPMPLVDHAGNVIIVHHAIDPTYPDQIGRRALALGGDLGANNHYPMTGRQLKEAVIPRTISGALKLGRALEQARATGADPLAVVGSEVGGRHVFSGRVVKLAEREDEGFYATIVELASEPAGTVAHLTIQNETMLLTLNDTLAAVFPDLVLMLDPETGRGILSTELAAGRPLALVTAPCHPRLRRAARSDAGRAAFSPATFGRPDVDYRPVEDFLPAAR
jgi:DUF917 family protein